MQVMVEGKKDGKKVCYTWDLFDKYDPASRVHSMARTTGYSATVALRMIADGVYSRKGISVPEFIGRQPECVAYLLEGLKQRGVIYKETVCK
jgi:saccharopine dehydrogenase-like NADP-dependent oxidoreductase